MHEKSDTGTFTDASTGSAGKADSVSGVTIGVDVGGTKIAAGVVDGHGTILRTARRPTPRHDSNAVLAEVAASRTVRTGTWVHAKLGAK